MPRKVFTAGEILTAADVNTNLMDQAVMVFDDSAARDAAIPTPSEGMVTYLKDTNQVQAFDGSAFAPIGTILQVVSETITGPVSFSSAAGAITTIADLDATITPSSTSNKVLVFVYTSVSASVNSNGVGGSLILKRDATAVGIGGASGSRVQSTVGAFTGTVNFGAPAVSFNVLDSPETTSAVTYSVDFHLGDTGTRTIVVNRTPDDTNSNQTFRAASRITLMEVAG